MPVDNKNLEIAKDILLPELLTTHPELKGVMFCGSRVGSEYYDDSDFDFRCILPEDLERFRITRKFQKYWLEYFCNSKSQEIKYLEEGETATIAMYRDGVILFDPEGLLSDLKNIFINWETKTEPDKFQILQIQYELAIFKLKMTNTQIAPDNFLYLDRVFNVILKGFLTLRPECDIKFIKLGEEIEQTDPTFSSLVKRFLLTLNFTEKKVLIVEMIDYLQQTFDLKDDISFDSRNI